MDEDPIRVETEEPFTGWLRVEVEGRKPSYRSPFPRTTITSAAKLGEFLEKEQSGGRMLDVDVSHFSFKRRMGLKKRSAPSPPPEADDAHDPQMLSRSQQAIMWRKAGVLWSCLQGIMK